eukprot:15178240-Alexandrium_andersonii.AAC.1
MAGVLARPGVELSRAVVGDMAGRRRAWATVAPRFCRRSQGQQAIGGRVVRDHLVHQGRFGVAVEGLGAGMPHLAVALR